MYRNLQVLIENSWSKETCSTSLQRDWNIYNRNLGQNDVTALVVNDILGGKIMHIKYGNKDYFYNLVDNKIIDYSLDNSYDDMPHYNVGEEMTREELLKNSDVRERYYILLNNFSNLAREQQNQVKVIKDKKLRGIWEVKMETLIKKIDNRKIRGSWEVKLINPKSKIK